VINDTQEDAISCSGNGLRLVVSDEPEAREVSTGVSRSQQKSAAQAQFGAASDAAHSAAVSTVDDLRVVVENCESLPEHIRAAVLALLSMTRPES
jgi:hypothetical protein